MARKIFVIACEASGDMHAAHLIHELKRLDRGFDFRGLGGPQMKAEGAEILQDMTQISALGLGDVIRQYGKYRSVFYRALQDLKDWNPDALIVVDSPAFNLRFARKVKQSRPDLDILYYICPQIWAWGRRRIGVVRRYISKLFSILPFEVDFYREAGMDCEYVGHPLLDRIVSASTATGFRRKLGLREDQLAIGLLPGSRSKEVERILPIQLKAAMELKQSLPDARFFVTRSANVDFRLYESIGKKFNLDFTFLEGRLEECLPVFNFALVASGTATLQTALAGVPFILIYKASWSTYWLGRLLIQVPYLGLVNLLAGKPVVPEFIQGSAQPKVIAAEARRILMEPGHYERMKKELREACGKLGHEGASRRAARLMTDYLNRDTARQTPVRQPDRS